MIGQSKPKNQRKQAEERFWESENYYRTLIQNLPQKIFLKDKNSVYLSCNEKYSRDLKIRPGEITGKTDYDFYPKELAEKYRADDKRIMESGKTEDIEERYIQDGIEVIVHTVKTPIKNEKGKIIGILGIFWDITQRKRAEDDLVKYREHLEELVEKRTAELRIANEQLQREITERRQTEKVLREYQRAIEGSKDMIAVVDQNYNYLLANNAFLKYRGMDREQVVGRSVPEVLGKDVFESVVKKKLDTCFQGEVTQYEMKYTYPEFGERDLLVSYFPVEGPDGVNRVASVIQDITERKRVEEALVRSEKAAKRLAQENAIVAEIGRIISSTLNIEEVYERFAEEVRKLIPFDRISININNPEENTITIAYTAGIEVPGRQVGDVITLDGSVNKEILRTRLSFLIQLENRAELVARFPTLLSYLQVGFQSMISVPLISKNKVIGVLHLRSFKTNAYTEMDLKLAERVANQVAGVIANAQLFIERKQAEEALKKSEERFQKLFNEAPVGYHELDPEGRITRVNRTELQMFGYTAEEMVGRYVWEFIVEEISQKSVMAKIAGILPIQKSFVRNYRCKDGTIIPVLMEERLLKDNEGRIIGIRSIQQDITERKKAEEELRKAHEMLEKRVEERTAELSKANELLKQEIAERKRMEEKVLISERLATLGLFSGSISHELKNPLSTIDSSVYYLKTKLKDADEKVRTHLDRIKSSVGSTLAIIDSLRNLTQIKEPRLERIDLISITFDTIANSKVPETVNVIQNITEQEVLVNADPEQLKMAFKNIVNNAIQAMDGKGTLEVTVGKINGQAELSFTDTGPGIAPENLDKIFQPLFSTKAKGLGFGLSIAEMIIDNHSGTIEAKSEPGKGATFLIRLPLYIQS